MIKKYFFSLLLISFALIIESCKKDIPNPYDNEELKAPEPPSNEPNLDPNSFAYIYKNVFKPTCANSSCHDGSFEPDFRTLNGAYNTLVYQPVISNDATYSFTYRVVPGSSGTSLLWKRLTQNPYGSIGQGRMPWNDPTWMDQPTNAQYIQNIINWIDAGAKDMFGNSPSIGNQDPRIMGLMIFPAGSTSSAYSRSGTDPINVPANSTVDIWVAITDDTSLPQNMVQTDIKISTQGFDFTNVASQSMTYSTPFSGNDFWGSTTSYTHKLASFSTAAYLPGTILYVRTYTKDPDHSSASEIPGDSSSEDTIKYFTIKII